MTSITCDVVRDLLPSYVEGLSSADTIALVDEHLEGCPGCRKVLEAMRADMGAETQPSADDRREIDFLKHNRTRNRRIALVSILAALVTIGVVLALRLFAIGSATPGGHLASTVSVEGSHLVLDLTPIDSASGVAGVSFEESDGVVSVTTKSVLASFLHPGSVQTSYTAAGPIQQVRVNGQVVWADGSEVSALAARLFDTRHDFVGDMSANGRSLVALGVTNYLGALQHELQTEAEPFGWTMYLQQDVVGAHQALMESDMRSFAYALIALVGNLDHITYDYTVDGKAQTLTVSAADATAFFGQDVKSCYENVRLLDELLDKTGISALVAG